MIAQFTFGERVFQADLQKGIDCSIPLSTDQQVNCFYAPLFETAPVIAGDFIGSTARGGLVNFLNVRINPHGNGTHTECVGHIAKEPYTINQTLRQFHWPARLVSVYPQRMESGDRVITQAQWEDALGTDPLPPALVIRTMPNHADKLGRTYSGTNPPYLDSEGVTWLVERGVQHLLLDLPSVDREEDGGALAAHKAFWQYPGETVREQSTITELIFVPDEVPDGWYLLHLSIASFEIDVSPSKPVLYPLTVSGPRVSV
ncbi:MAG: cyclase family protein [Bacteroidota bacterium]